MNYKNIKILNISKISEKDWDNFVLTNDGFFFHTYNFLIDLGLIYKNNESLAIKYENNIICLIPLFFDKIKKTYISGLYSPNGLLFQKHKVLFDIDEIIEQIINRNILLHHNISLIGFPFLNMNLAEKYEQLILSSKSLKNFRFFDDNLIQNDDLFWSILRINNSDELMIKSVKPSFRRLIKNKIPTHNIHVRNISDNIDLYENLYIKAQGYVHNRFEILDPISTYLLSFDYFHHFSKKFSKYIKTFVLLYNDIPVSILSIIVFNNTAYYFRGYVLNEYKHMHFGAAIQWEVIKQMNGLNVTHYVTGLYSNNKESPIFDNGRFKKSFTNISMQSINYFLDSNKFT